MSSKTNLSDRYYSLLKKELDELSRSYENSEWSTFMENYHRLKGVLVVGVRLKFIKEEIYNSVRSILNEIYNDKR